jgi:hypothetical protein
MIELASLFGLTPSRRGWLRYGESITDQLGPGGLQQSIADYSQALPLSQLEQAAGEVGGGVLDILPRLQEQLRRASGFAGEAAETGFETSIDPIVKFANRIFTEDILPQIRETAIGGSGLQSTGFENAALREGSRLADQLGIQRYAAGEAAAGRRMGAIPQLANLSAAEAAFPINVASDLFSLGGGIRGAQEGIRRRPLDVFSMLMGQPGQPGQFAVGGYPTTDATSQLLAALATSVPQLTQAGGGLFGGGDIWDIPGPSGTSTRPSATPLWLRT